MDERMAEVAISEVTKTGKQIAREVESQNHDTQKETEKLIHEAEHAAITAAKFTQIATNSNWKSGVERTKKWEIEY